MRRRLKAQNSPNALLVLQEPSKIVQWSEVNKTESLGLEAQSCVAVLLLMFVVLSSACAIGWEYVRVVFLFRRGVNCQCGKRLVEDSRHVEAALPASRPRRQQGCNVLR